MKDKNVAGILALFLGGFGAHWFYLGKPGRAILHLVFFWFPLSWIIALITSIVFFSMDAEKFNYKYNYAGPERPDFKRFNTDYHRDRRQPWESEMRRRQAENAAKQRQAAHSSDSKLGELKKSGVEKFKDYDYDGAIEDFKKALALYPKDVAAHFNIACAYSLNENAKEAFEHLDKAVELGFDDFQKIKTHDALAYLRVQDEFDTFERNGFRLTAKQPDAPQQDDLLNTKPDLLDQIKKLGDLRENGLLTEEEFVEQKRKLLG